MAETDSHLPFGQSNELSPTLVAAGTSSLFCPPEDNDLPPRPSIAPKIPPGFEKTVPTPRPESQASLNMSYQVRIVLLEQELMNRNAQLDEVIREKARLNKLHQNEEAKVFELVRELQHCERRAAQSEVAVDFFAELNVRRAAKLKENQEPDGRIFALKEELQRSNHDSQNKIQALEMETRNLKSDNERLNAKLEYAMSTIIALSSVAASSQNPCIPKSSPQPVADAVHHNNLIDLMDDCLTPTQQVSIEDPSTTLLDDIDDVEGIEVPATAETLHDQSDSFDSDFSNSSYIVRFKGIRDMTKENATIPKRCDTQDEDFAIEKKACKLDQERTRNLPSSAGTSLDKESAPSGPASPSSSHNDGSANLSPESTSRVPDQKKSIISAPRTQDKDPLANDTLTDEDYSNIAPSKEDRSNVRNKSGYFRNSSMPNTLKSAPRKVFPTFKNTAKNGAPIQLHQRNSSSEENLPAFFKHGIQFRPGSTSTEVYRTIVISNVASNVKMFDLLDKIRGGNIFDAKLLSMPRITENASALITFLEEHAALAYRDYTMKHPILMGGLPLKVTLLTPTWPIRPEFRKKIMDYQMTRCLEVYNFPKHVSQKRLKEHLQTSSNMTTTWVTYLHLNRDGLLKIHFSSVMQASHAHQVFSSNKSYAMCKFCFVHDPCAGPLETINQTDSVLPNFVWERSLEVADETNVMHGRDEEELKQETDILSCETSKLGFVSPLCNECRTTLLADKQLGESINIEAACCGPVGGMSEKLDEMFPPKNPPVPDEIPETMNFDQKNSKNSGINDEVPSKQETT